MDEIVKGLKIGVGIVAVAIVVGLCYIAWDTHRMALRGDAAATFIERVNAQPPPSK